MDSRRHVLLLGVMLFGWLGVTAASHAGERPALVVVISIDQFRYDYLERFRPHFGEQGFRRLLDGGADFADCHFEHSYTKTGPGHAVMLTGVHANINGIIANDWLDRTTLERVSCVGDPSVQILGLPARQAAAPAVKFDDPYLGRSPRTLLAGTVGDELRIAGGRRPKVIGISNKDRAAILMSGRFANAAYFMEEGRMVTSTYYMAELPEWVRAWNEAKKTEAYFGRVWDRALPAAAYEQQGPDDAPGEDETAGKLGRTLPKTVTGGDASPGHAFYDAFENTPFSNEVLADFARAAIEHEQLGQREGVSDLMCLSFSANDHLGHLYGPDSHEIMDNVVRMDRTLAEFFGWLDQRVGLRRCTIVLTADHGAAPMPEYLQSLHPDQAAGRIQGSVLMSACEAALNRTFGALAGQAPWLARDDASLLLRPGALAEKKVTAVAAQECVRAALRELDFVQAAYTRDELEREAVTNELGRGMLLSFNRQRSGDVFYQPRPYFISRGTGTNHASPYNYDTHVPLVWYGVGVKVGRYPQRVSVADLAPTLASILGISAPPRASGRVLF